MGSYPPFIANNTWPFAETCRVPNHIALRKKKRRYNLDSLGSLLRLSQDWLPSLMRCTHLKLFFISRSAAITETGSLLPVAFCISGSWVENQPRFWSHAESVTYTGSHERIVLLIVVSVDELY